MKDDPFCTNTTYKCKKNPFNKTKITKDITFNCDKYCKSNIFQFFMHKQLESRCRQSLASNSLCRFASVSCALQCWKKIGLYLVIF